MDYVTFFINAYAYVYSLTFLLFSVCICRAGRRNTTSGSTRIVTESPPTTYTPTLPHAHQPNKRWRKVYNPLVM